MQTNVALKAKHEIFPRSKAKATEKKNNPRRCCTAGPPQATPPVLPSVSTLAENISPLLACTHPCPLYLFLSCVPSQTSPMLPLTRTSGRPRTWFDTAAPSDRKPRGVRTCQLRPNGKESAARAVPRPSRRFAPVISDISNRVPETQRSIRR